MRNFINIINEAVKPTKTSDKVKGEFDFMPSLEPGGAVATAGATKKDVQLPGTKAKRGKHRFKAIELDPEVGSEVARNMGSITGANAYQQLGGDVADDYDAYRNAGHDDDEAEGMVEPTPPNIENLPAVLRQEMGEHTGKFFPEWHQVRDLPGMFRTPIRMLGQRIFSQFTDTPTDDIQVVTTLGNINPRSEVQAMAAWIMKNGARDHNAKIDFEQIMPGYSADYSYWHTKDFSFLIVKDFGGEYIYGWTGGRGVHLDAPPERKRLR